MAGKKQDRLSVFMLHAGQGFPLEVRNIMFQLPRRMRIQLQPNIIGNRFDGRCIRILPQQCGHLLKMLRLQHFAQRKR